MKQKKSKNSEKRLKEKARKISIMEGSAYGVSEGLGIRYVTPYALAMGANSAHIGFLSTFPSLIGNFLQLFSIRAIEKHSRKKIVFFGVALQALMWLALIGVGSLFFVFNLNQQISNILLIATYTLLIVFGSIAGPAWSSWMKDIIPKKSANYFAQRSTIVGGIILVSMLAAGFILDYFKQTKIFVGFIILFSFSFIFRSISALLFLKQYEPKLILKKGYYFSFGQFLKKMPENNFGKFVIFVSFVLGTTAIASPFFSVYMLKHLNLNYVPFTLIIMSSTVTSLIFIPLWGKFANVYGNLKVIKICSVFIPTIPALWIFSKFFGPSHLLALIIYLIFIEAFSGFVWAGFSLSSTNFIYDAVTKQRMALCVSYSNILNGIIIFLGATLGGFIASTEFTFLSLNSMLFIFLLSAIARLVSVLIMLPKIKEVREVKKFKIIDVKEKIMSYF
ncbi:MAG: MFS transporter [Nanoarchaeota archaeon]